MALIRPQGTKTVYEAPVDHFGQDYVVLKLNPQMLMAWYAIAYTLILHQLFDTDVQCTVILNLILHRNSYVRRVLAGASQGYACVCALTVRHLHGFSKWLRQLHWFSKWLVLEIKVNDVVGRCIPITTVIRNNDVKGLRVEGGTLA